jgi:hypothetical protein
MQGAVHKQRNRDTEQSIFHRFSVVKGSGPRSILTFHGPIYQTGGDDISEGMERHAQWLRRAFDGLQLTRHCRNGHANGSQAFLGSFRSVLNFML